MHSLKLAHVRHHDHLRQRPRPRFRKAVEKAPSDSAHSLRPWHSIADDPSRARIRAVRLVPLIVPGIALFLLLCLALILSLL